MAYQLVNTSQGQFAIDWDVVTRIIRSRVRSEMQLRHSKTVTESQTSLDPFSWGLPDLKYVTVDWATVNIETLSGTWGRGLRLAALTYQSVDSLVRELKTMQAETIRYQGKFQEEMRKASQFSWGEMEKSVSKYGTLVDGAKIVEALSASVLIGASTAGIGVAGSGAVWMAGAGTALKTNAKYRDTGKVGCAVIEAGQNILFTVIPPLRGAALAGKEKVVKVIVSASADTGKALLEGKSVNDSLLDGSMQLAVPGVRKIVESKAVQTVLNAAAVPVVTKILTGQAEILRKLPTEVTTKVAEDALKKAGPSAVRAAVAKIAPQGEPPRLQAGTQPDALVDALSFTDDLLLKFSIVDMEKGIGRSWW
jgi:hypothetical protein